MTNDILHRLGQLAPTDDDLSARWPAEARADLAHRIVTGELDSATVRLRHRPGPGLRRRPGGPTARRSGRRGLVIATLTATAAAAALVVPTLLPEGSPGAASPAAADVLHRLAVVAAHTPADRLRPGQFVRTVSVNHQVGVPENPEAGPVVLDSRSQSWTAYDGRTWTRRVDGHTTTTFVARAYVESGAAYFASLPTEPDELRRYLSDHAHGSSSHDEAVFLAVGDVLANATAPAALRSAAATVLAGTDHVRLGPETRDDQGRPVRELDFVDESIRPGQVQALFVDRRTAQVVGSRDTQPGATYGSTLISSEVVDEVPADVLRTACPESGRIC